MCGNASERHNIHMADNAKTEQKIKRRIQKIQRVLSIVLALSLAYLALYRLDSHRQEKENAKLREMAGVFAEKSADSPAGSAGESPDGAMDADTAQGAETLPPTEEETSGSASKNILPGYETLVQINPQIKGWIAIPDTSVSFPLLQGEDNDYYLKHDIYGQENRYGSIFVDCDADLYGSESNLIIYGHHMRDGSMFGGLKAYREESYYREHPSFFLYLPEEEREYEIIAVLHNDIFSREQEPFQYYDYAHILNEEMFAEYYRGIKEHALYDTEVSASYGDELVTLCTCDYGGREQRLLVVGRRL